MDTQTKESQSNLTPNQAKQLLVEGNKRFVSGKLEKHNYREQIKITYEKGQYPHTAVLGCIDSRATSEQIFDQGIGDIFNTRIAGNVINDDVLGSLEFSCNLAGSKLIVVLGHTHCGAVSGACNDVKIGHLSTLLNKIHPAVEEVRESVNDITSPDSVNLVAKANVLNSMREIRAKSIILRKMEEEGEIKIVGAMYYIESGVVEFYK